MGEEAIEVVRDLQERMISMGLRGTARPILKPFRKKTLPKNTAIVTDNIARLVEGSLSDTVQLLFKLLERGCTVIVLASRSDRSIQTIDQTWLPYLRLLGHELPKAHRSLQIKMGQYLARQKGLCVGRPIVSIETEQAAFEVLAHGHSLRTAEKILRDRGIQISRSSLGRLAQFRKASKV
jgi:DNA invertase Pin-like site-specific DNA recombinase